MVLFPQCTDCKHLKDEKTADGKFCCPAFPEGIPDGVFWNRVSHKENLEDDHGIKFEPLT